jgi:hypothetical protein
MPSSDISVSTQIPMPSRGVTPSGVHCTRQYMGLTKMDQQHRNRHPLVNFDLNRTDLNFELVQDQRQVKRVPLPPLQITTLPLTPISPQVLHAADSPANPFLRSPTWFSPTRIPKSPSSPNLGGVDFKILRGHVSLSARSLSFGLQDEDMEGPIERRLTMLRGMTRRGSTSKCVRRLLSHQAGAV